MQDDRGKGFSADFGRTADDYAAHRVGFPGSFFARLAVRGIGVPGQNVLDLGTGTGVVARSLAGHGCRVVGLDIAAAPIAAARMLDRKAGVDTNYVVARAESTGLAAAVFDVVVAGQCWHWFERRKVADECRRLLRPDGRLVIAHYDWIALPGNVVEATEALIVSHNPAWTFSGGNGFYPRWLRGLARGGYDGLETFSYDVDQPYSHESWRGRVRASAGIGASLSPEQVARFDAEHAAMLTERFPDDPLSVLHRVFAVIAQR
jgi:SAM-dependent methyltransferase